MRSGGTYPIVSGHPPHRSTQYPFIASISLSRATCSPRRRMMTTLFGRASSITRRSSFPRLHDFQYGFGFVTAHSREQAPLNESETRKRCSRNRRVIAPVHINRETFVTFAAVTSRCDEQPPSRMGAAVRPEAGFPPARVPPATPFPHGRKTGVSSPGPLCTFPVVFGASQQRRRNIVRLSPGLAFAPRSTGQPFLARDYRSPSKAQVNHVAHSLVSKSAPRLEASQR